LGFVLPPKTCRRQIQRGQRRNFVGHIGRLRHATRNVGNPFGLAQGGEVTDGLVLERPSRAGRGGKDVPVPRKQKPRKKNRKKIVKKKKNKDILIHTDHINLPNHR
jgi:hypothetical protein